MDKKTILKIFGEAFLRSMVVLMAIVIIGFSAFFVIKVTTDKKQAKENEVAQEDADYSDDELQDMLEEENQKTSEETTEEVTTEATTEATTEVEVITSEDSKILVLNSTSVAGLAKAWMDKLKGEGFSDVQTGNYSLSKDAQTKIYVAKEGMGSDLLDYFSDATIEVGILSSGVDVSTTDVEIFIVLGSNDSSVK